LMSSLVAVVLKPSLIMRAKSSMVVMFFFAICHQA
jgi:hypothetical protein